MPQGSELQPTSSLRSTSAIQLVSCPSGIVCLRNDGGVDWTSASSPPLRRRMNAPDDVSIGWVHKWRCTRKVRWKKASSAAERFAARLASSFPMDPLVRNIATDGRKRSTTSSANERPMSSASASHCFHMAPNAFTRCADIVTTSPLLCVACQVVALLASGESPIFQPGIPV